MEIYFQREIKMNLLHLQVRGFFVEGFPCEPFQVWHENYKVVPELDCKRTGFHIGSLIGFQENGKLILLQVKSISSEKC